MNYLIIGASGFIGQTIYDCCKSAGLSVFGTYNKNSENSDLIKYNQTCETLLDLLYKCGIYDYSDLAVVMCAANTSIDSCKRNENESRLLNVLSIERMIDEASKLGIKPVFLSSEAVFDGEKGQYSEADMPHPITVYGKQKLEVENYIVENSNNYLVFRISRAVSSVPGRRDIFDDFHAKIVKGNSIVCIRNQSFNPTDVGDIANCVIMSCEKRLVGRFHLANRDYVTRAELASMYAESVLHMKANIIEKDCEEFDFADKRHILGGLDASLIEKYFRYRFKTINEILSARGLLLS